MYIEYYNDCVYDNVSFRLVFIVYLISGILISVMNSLCFVGLIFLFYNFVVLKLGENTSLLSMVYEDNIDSRVYTT